MTDTASLLIFFGAVFAGVAIGSLVGWRRGTLEGAGIGALVIGVGAAVGAGGVAWDRWQFVSKSERVQGRLVHHAGGPVVEFTPVDGFTRTVKGLGGSQADAQPGDAIPVYFLNGDPSTERVADFQNVWGIVFALCAFAALPLAFRLFFVVTAIGERRIRRVRPGTSVPPARWRTSAGRIVAMLGNVAIVGALALSALADEVEAGIGRAFLGVAAAALLHALAFMLRGRADPQVIGVCLVLALGFGLFGGGALLLGG